MPSDIVFWIIGFVFFQPLHLGLPILYLFIYGNPRTRAKKTKRVVIHGVTSSALLFCAAAGLFADHKLIAIGLVLVSIPLPWIGLRDQSEQADNQKAE